MKQPHLDPRQWHRALTYANVSTRPKFWRRKDSIHLEKPESFRCEPWHRENTHNSRCLRRDEANRYVSLRLCHKFTSLWSYLLKTKRRGLSLYITMRESNKASYSIIYSIGASELRPLETAVCKSSYQQEITQVALPSSAAEQRDKRSRLRERKMRSWHVTSPFPLS